ncbi:MAG: hypothetical protein ACKVTZ_03015 [Bacteroidia bacterium]
MKIICRVIFLLAIFLEMSRASAQPLSLFLDEEYGFQIEYPSYWLLNDNGLTSVNPFKVSTPRNSVHDFQEYMKVTVLDDAENTLEANFRENMVFMKQNVPGFTVLKYGDAQIGRKHSIWATYSYEVVKKKKPLLGMIPRTEKKIYVAKSYTILHENKVYILTGTAEKDNFERYEKMFDEMAQSFSFMVRDLV